MLFREAWISLHGSSLRWGLKNVYSEKNLLKKIECINHVGKMMAIDLWKRRMRKKKEAKYSEARNIGA